MLFFVKLFFYIMIFFFYYFLLIIWFDFYFIFILVDWTLSQNFSRYLVVSLTSLAVFSQCLQFSIEYLQSFWELGNPRINVFHILSPPCTCLKAFFSKQPDRDLTVVWCSCNLYLPFTQKGASLAESVWRSHADERCTMRGFICNNTSMLFYWQRLVIQVCDVESGSVMCLFKTQRSTLICKES